MQPICNAIAQLPLAGIILVCLTLGLAPFFPEPHLWEKIKMLMNGTLSRPIDIFDMLLHGAPWLVLIARLTICRGTGA